MVDAPARTAREMAIRVRAARAEGEKSVDQAVVRFEIPKPLPSLNAVYGAHWAKKHRLRQEWGWEVRSALLALERDWDGNRAVQFLRLHVKEKGRVLVRVETWRKRRLDDENARAGGKGLVDSLKSEGLIVDDHPKWIDRAFFQHLGEPYRTTVELLPIDAVLRPPGIQRGAD